jgi:hypothetical protein
VRCTYLVNENSRPLAMLFTSSGKHPLVTGSAGCSGSNSTDIHPCSFAASCLNMLSTPLLMPAAYELTEGDIAVPLTGFRMGLVILSMLFTTVLSR